MNRDLACIHGNLAIQKALPAHSKCFQIQNKWGNSWKKQQGAIHIFLWGKLIISTGDLLEVLKASYQNFHSLDLKQDHVRQIFHMLKNLNLYNHLYIIRIPDNCNHINMKWRVQKNLTGQHIHTELPFTFCYSWKTKKYHLLHPSRCWQLIFLSHSKE